jgi:hypothetical protein
MPSHDVLGDLGGSMFFSLVRWKLATGSRSSNAILKRGRSRVPPEKFRVALIQMSCGPEPEENLEKALSRTADAAGRGAQVVCLPELFQTQYFCQREDHALFDLAEPIPGRCGLQERCRSDRIPLRKACPRRVSQYGGYL